jgi:hypothetical protein
MTYTRFSQEVVVLLSIDGVADTTSTIASASLSLLV